MALPGTRILEAARDATNAVAFVETGTHRGDGLALAMEVEFDDYFSVEASEFAFGWASCRFQGVPKVHLHHGDSRDFLSHLLPPGGSGGIYGPCVLWLDAHWCGGNGEIRGEEPEPAPLLDELAIIRRHRCKRHAILIDDVRNFGTELPARDDVVAAVMAINPNYEIRYADGRDFAEDILVAVPR